MYSNNKPPMTREERDHVARVKSLPCAVCGCSLAVSEAHEIEQGQWFTSIPLCPDCHRGSHNGLHGQRRIWMVMKKTELSCLNDTIRKLMRETRGCHVLAPGSR